MHSRPSLPLCSLERLAPHHISTPCYQASQGDFGWITSCCGSFSGFPFISPVNLLYFHLKEFHMITAGCLPSPHRQQKELFIIHYSDTEPWLPHKDFANLVWVLTMRCFLSVTLQDNLSIVRQYELQDHLFECYSWLSWEVNANQHRCWSVLNFTWPISICLDQTNPSVMKMLKKKTYHAAKAD